MLVEVVGRQASGEGRKGYLLADTREEGLLNPQYVMVVVEALPAGLDFAKACASVSRVSTVVALFSQHAT